jgi:hypothetical protein
MKVEIQIIKIKSKIAVIFFPRKGAKEAKQQRNKNFSKHSCLKIGPYDVIEILI